MKPNRIIQEIKNWFYIKSVIRKESGNPNSQWNRFKLRSNWYGRIYTVVSLREEDMGEEKIVQQWKAMELMRPINTYLSSLELQELIYPSIEEIPDSRSYLIVYSPIFKHLTIFKVISTLILVVIGISILIHFL